MLCAMAIRYVVRSVPPEGYLNPVVSLSVCVDLECDRSDKDSDAIHRDVELGGDLLVRQPFD